MRLYYVNVVFQELTLSESLHFLVPGLTNISALADLRQLSLTKVAHNPSQSRFEM